MGLKNCEKKRGEREKKKRHSTMLSLKGRQARNDIYLLTFLVSSGDDSTSTLISLTSGDGGADERPAKSLAGLRFPRVRTDAIDTGPSKNERKKIGLHQSQTSPQIITKPCRENSSTRRRLALIKTFSFNDGLKIAFGREADCR
jgi:hypothetical protein